MSVSCSVSDEWPNVTALIRMFNAAALGAASQAFRRILMNDSTSFCRSALIGGGGWGEGFTRLSSFYHPPSPPHTIQSRTRPGAPGVAGKAPLADAQERETFTHSVNP